MNPRLTGWRRSLLVVLFGTPALCADLCSGLPAGSANGWDYWPDPQHDSRAPGVFRLQPKPAGPAFRITVTTIASPALGAPVHAGDIQVDRCQDGKPVQRFPIVADQPINFGLSFDSTDINFDGYPDFSVLVQFAAGWKARAYWIYDPGSQRFVKNQLTRKLEKDWKGYLIAFDPAKREITLGILMAYSACLGSEPDVYRVVDNRPILAHRVEINGYAPQRCTVKVWDIVGGVLRVTSERRVDAEGHPVGPDDVPPPARVEPPAFKMLPVEPPPPAPGTLLAEHPLDSSHEGLYSTGRGPGQVAADRFVIPNGATITGLRWYGYRNCGSDPGNSQAFEIAFFSDQNGLPGGEPLSIAHVQAHITPTASSVADSFRNHFQIFLYNADLASPLAIPAGRPTWVMVRQGTASCGFLWNRGRSTDSDAAAWGTAGGTDKTQYSEWHHLASQAHFAFSLYGAK